MVQSAQSKGPLPKAQLHYPSMLLQYLLLNGSDFPYRLQKEFLNGLLELYSARILNIVPLSHIQVYNYAQK